MKYWVTILILSLTVFSFGQSLSDISKRLSLLESRVGFKHDTTGFSSLPKFDYVCDNESQNKSDYYHVTDLNNDGLNDLIYSGPCKPYDQTGIFLNDGSRFKRVYNYPGKIISIDKGTSTTIINILKEACCCDYYSDYIEVTIDHESKIAKNIITFEANTKISLGNKLKSVKVVGTIRTAPEINNVAKKDDCRNEIIKGNQLIRSEEFRNIVQLNKVGSWWLVLYQENKEKSWIGWIKMN
jgi:hypothetical protein